MNDTCNFWDDCPMVAMNEDERHAVRMEVLSSLAVLLDGFPAPISRGDDVMSSCSNGGLRGNHPILSGYAGGIRAIGATIRGGEGKSGAMVFLLV